MERNWKVDYKKFRTYLKDKYNVEEAYYFFGYVSEEQQDMYNKLQKAGFIILFKEHSASLKGKKKGNVDTDIVFEVMKILVERKDFSKIVLIKKILFPNKQFASSLYNKLGSEFFDYLETPDVRSKIAYK